MADGWLFISNYTLIIGLKPYLQPYLSGTVLKYLNRSECLGLREVKNTADYTEKTLEGTYNS